MKLHAIEVKIKGNTPDSWFQYHPPHPDLHMMSTIATILRHNSALLGVRIVEYTMSAGVVIDESSVSLAV